MPAVTCLRCKRDTNTAMCDWIDCEKNKTLEGSDYPKYADRCYAAWVDGKWEKGCAWDDEDANPYTKASIASYLRKSK